MCVLPCSTVRVHIHTHTYSLRSPDGLILLCRRSLHFAFVHHFDDMHAVLLLHPTVCIPTWADARFRRKGSARQCRSSTHTRLLPRPTGEPGPPDTPWTHRNRTDPVRRFMQNRIRHQLVTDRAKKRWRRRRENWAENLILTLAKKTKHGCKRTHTRAQLNQISNL